MTPGLRPDIQVLDQNRAIMKLMIVVSTVGLTKKLLRCYVDVQKHLEQLLEYPNQSKSLFMHFSRFELYTLLETKTLKVAGCTEIRNVTVYRPLASIFKPKTIKGSCVWNWNY